MGPDISFAVNKLAQFMHKPTTTHFTALKRVLRYLKHTLFHGIYLSKKEPQQLKVYTNSDSAGKIDDRSINSESLTAASLSCNLQLKEQETDLISIVAM